MNKTTSIINPSAKAASMAKPQKKSCEVRMEVSNILKELAFVLALTCQVREEILEDQQDKSTTII